VFIGLISFASALLMALTVMMLSNCVHSSQSPQNTPDNAPPSVANNKYPSSSQPQIPLAQQNSAGIFGLGNFFEDSKKSIAGAIGVNTGACGNDPEILGEWTETGSRNPIKLSFNECVESLSKLNSCSGTYSYSTKGGVLTGKLVTVKPSYCGQVGSTDTAQYEIKGDTLTLQGGSGGAHAYRRTANKGVETPVNHAEVKINSGSWFPAFDFSWIHTGP